MGAPAPQEGGLESPRPEPGVLAVRSGLAEPPSSTVELEDLVRKALSSRAGLRSVGDVLPAPQASLVGEATEEMERVPLPGEGRILEREGQDAERAEGPERRRAQLEERRSEPESHERAEQRTDERLDDGDSLDRASSVASQTGAVSNPAEERRRDAGLDEPNRDGDAVAQAVAEKTFSHTATVEATLDQELTARFFRNTEPEEERGPVPRAREEIGTRSRPVDLKA